MLDGKRLLITGVLTKGSIAYSVAERAQEQGAQVVLTGFGRTRRMTERAAARLPDPPDVLELDVNNPEDFEALVGELSSAGAASTAPCTRSPSRPATRSAATSCPRRRSRPSRHSARAPTRSRRWPRRWRR